MAAPVLPCDSCGSPIPDSDLETGTAITLLGKRYCVGCKTEAIQGVSLDELGGRPAAAPARAAAPKPAPKPAPAPAPKPPPRAAAPPPAPVAPERKAPPPRRPAVAAPAPSRTPLLIAAGGVIVVVAVVAVVVVLSRPSPPEPTGTTPSPRTPDTATPPPDRDAVAREAFTRVDALARGGASFDHLVAAIEKAKPACRGTSWEKKLEEVRARALQQKEAEDAARELAPLLDELKGAVATDPEFKRYAELQSKFQMALEMAGKTASPRMAEIRALQKDYNGKYEKLAEPHFAEINEAATQLAEEKRYDDALRKINTFPQHLRLSVSWISLDKLRQDIERRKKEAPPKRK